jgi:hypothetical protein
MWSLLCRLAALWALNTANGSVPYINACTLVILETPLPPQADREDLMPAVRQPDQFD